MPPDRVELYSVCKLRHTILIQTFYLLVAILCFVSATFSQATPEANYAVKSFEEYSNPAFRYNTLAKLKCEEPNVIFDILVLQYLAPHYQHITGVALSVYASYFTRHMNTYFPGSRLALGTFSSQGSDLPCYDLIMPLTNDAETVRQGFARLSQELETVGQKVQHFTPPHPHLGRLAAATAALDSRLGWDHDPVCPSLPQSSPALRKKKRAKVIVLFANDFAFFIPASPRLEQVSKFRTAKRNEAASCSATGPSYVIPSSTSPDAGIPIRDDETLVSLLKKKHIWVTTYLTNPTFETLQESLLYDQMKFSQSNLQQVGQLPKPLPLPGKTFPTIPHPNGYVEDITNSVVWSVCRPDPTDRAPLREVDCHVDNTAADKDQDTPNNTDSTPESSTTNVSNSDQPSEGPSTKPKVPADRPFPNDKDDPIPNTVAPDDINHESDTDKDKPEPSGGDKNGETSPTNVVPTKEDPNHTNTDNNSNNNDNHKKPPESDNPAANTDTEPPVTPSNEGSTENNNNSNPKETPDRSNPTTNSNTETRPPPKEGSTPDRNDPTTETDKNTTNNTGDPISTNDKETGDTGRPMPTTNKETTGTIDPSSTSDKKTKNTDALPNTDGKPTNTNNPNVDKDRPTSDIGDTTQPTHPPTSTNDEDKDANTPTTSTDQDSNSSTSTQSPKEKPSSAAPTLPSNPRGFQTSSTVFILTKPPITSSPPNDDSSGLQPAVSYALAISGVFCVFTASVCGLAHWKARKEKPTYLLEDPHDGSAANIHPGYADDWTRELTNFSYSYSGNDNESDPAKTDLESNRDDEASLAEEDYVSSVNTSTPSLRYASVPPVAPDHAPLASNNDTTDSTYVSRRVHLHAT